MTDLTLPEFSAQQRLPKPRPTSATTAITLPYQPSPSPAPAALAPSHVVEPRSGSGSTLPFTSSTAAATAPATTAAAAAAAAAAAELPSSNNTPAAPQRSASPLLPRGSGSSSGPSSSPPSSSSASSGIDRLSSLAAFVSGKTHALASRSSFSADRSNRRSLIAAASTNASCTSISTIAEATPAAAATTADVAPRKHSLPAAYAPGRSTTEKRLLSRAGGSIRRPSKSTSTESLLGSSDSLTRPEKTIPGHDGSSLADVSHSPRNKMHQTSSRLLRMTDDDRPFTRDFKDLFATLIVSLPLTTHRVRFKSYPYSFTSEEAINNLGSLKFSQSNRMPDPKDPSRIVTTTTTTTFSMAKEMARSVCQRFADARFIEQADGKGTTNFPLKGSLWQLTPKGIHILDRFCQRNGIQQEHVVKLLQSPFNTMRLVVLERDPKTDIVSDDKTSVEVLFRRFAGATPNIKTNVSVSDSDSVSDYQDGLSGVKLADSRKIYDKTIKNSFTGKCAVDWLLDCCTTVEKNETYDLCTAFVRFGLIQAILDDKVYIQQNPRAKDFQPTKNAIYVLTDKGKRVAGWIEPERSSLGDRSSEGAARGSSAVRSRDEHSPRDQRETNTTRLTAILNDAALRLLYREFLRETLCEENLAFYLDVVEFNKNFNAIDLNKPDAVRETLAAAYGLYNAFLAPGSPCELNIDHTLRQDMASRMTRAVAKDDASMYNSLKEVATLFDRAQQQVFKLMAGDSVPKFIRTQKYMEVAGDHSDDSASNSSAPERTMSLQKSTTNVRKMEPR